MISRQLSWRSSCVRPGVVVVAVIAGMLAIVSSAFAAAPPQFRKSETLVRVYPTRAHVFASVEIPFKLNTKIIAEYAPAEASGEAPPENSPAWKVLNEQESGPTPQEDIILGLGAQPWEYGGDAVVRHLSPDTAYFARFVAENQEGRGVETVPFKTLPLAPPEIDPLFASPAKPEADLEGRYFKVYVENATTATFYGVLEGNGSETSYSIEYSLPENGHEPVAGSSSWTLFENGSGTITPVAEYARFDVRATGLTPETTYYVRLRAVNPHGELKQSKYYGPSVSPPKEGSLVSGGEEYGTFTTATARPGVDSTGFRNVTGVSARVLGSVQPHGSATVWRLESASSPSGPWGVIPGSVGSLSLARVQALEAEAPESQAPYDVTVPVQASLTGLRASSSYYVRAVAETQCGQGCGSTVGAAARFTTSGAPSATTFMVHALDGEALRLLGTVDPNSEPTTAEQVVALSEASGGTFALTFKGHMTGQIAYNATPGAVEQALGSLEGDPQVTVAGVPGGPYTVWFNGADVQGAQPPIEADGLGLAPPGTVSVSVIQQGGEGDKAHYRFRYVSEKSFEEHGWTGAQETPEADAGSGTSAQLVGADLPALKGGETYRYRLVASNGAPGTGLVEGGEQSLVVPQAPVGGESVACPNEAVRTGLSAHLPDCRAYEQVTPVDKKGAQEPFHYIAGIDDAAMAGEDGEHLVVEALGVFWPGSGNSPYLFSRGPDGWSMAAGSPQPQTGVHLVAPEVYGADLKSFAFRSSYLGAEHESPVEYKVGPVGGPYTTVASFPYTEKSSTGWVAATGDMSKLVFETVDRTLTSEEPTGTKSGADLYEYTAADGLRQLNVAGEGDTTIGVCGARMAHGHEAVEELNGSGGSTRSISVDGSRVFFEAAPGNCGEPLHLYMRVDGDETVDIGAYKFEAADTQGTTLLLRDGTGSLVGYDTETREVVPEPQSELTLASELEQLAIPDSFRPEDGEAFHHPRYITWGDREPPNATDDEQAYRYDGAEHLLVCMSCASSFDTQPKQPAFTSDGTSAPQLKGGSWEYAASSEDGRFAFFSTPAALVGQDIDGEMPIEYGVFAEYLSPSDETSPSSDVYEWRADGVDGCEHAQGCLVLITDGRGGYFNLLLGTGDEGRDVFIYTRSKLLPQDTDTSGDVYDARVDGGFAPAPPRPTECEGDACSAPPPPPNDATPSSLTFNGAGNVAPTASSGKPAVKPKKAKPKKKKAAGRGAHRTRKRGKAKKGRRAVASDRGAEVANARSGR